PQLVDGADWVDGGDEGLPHQDSVVAGVVQGAGVGPAADTGLGHLHHAVGDGGGHAYGPLVVDLERDEVALVDTHEGGADLQGDLQLWLVVHFDQRVETHFGGQVVERAQLPGVEGGGDEQHAVGPHEASIAHVVRSHGEVLAQ